MNAWISYRTFCACTIQHGWNKHSLSHFWIEANLVVHRFTGRKSNIIECDYSVWCVCCVYAWHQHFLESPFRWCKKGWMCLMEIRTQQKPATVASTSCKWRKEKEEERKKSEKRAKKTHSQIENADCCLFQWNVCTVSIKGDQCNSL